MSKKAQKESYPTRTMRLHPRTVELFDRMRESSGKSVNLFLYDLLMESDPCNTNVTQMSYTKKRPTPYRSVDKFEKYDDIKKRLQLSPLYPNIKDDESIPWPEKVIYVWNEQLENVAKANGLNGRIRLAIEKAYEKYGRDAIVSALVMYNKVKGLHNTWHTNHYTLLEFFEKEEELDRFSQKPFEHYFKK